MPAALTREEAYDFLKSRAGFITLTTIDRRGYPHSVPLGYVVMGDDIYIGSRATNQRLKNVRLNPKVGLLLETGTGMQDIRGLVIQGDATIVDDPGRCLELLREGMLARGTAEDQLPKEPRPGISYIQVRPRRFISWDYSRQG